RYFKIIRRKRGKTKMKKILKTVFATMATTLLLTACSGGGTDSSDGGKSSEKSDDQSVTVWAWDETFNIAAVNEAKEFYEGKDVNVVTMSQDDIVQKLNTSLASGNTDGLPNIVLIEDYRIQGYLQSYPDSFSDLSEVVNE